MTHSVTAPKIAANEQEYLERSLAPVLGDVEYDGKLSESTLVIPEPNDLPGNDDNTVYRVFADAEPVAALFVVTAMDGFSGPIRILVGIRGDGRISGVRVLEHRETPGLGDLIEIGKSDWVLQFNGRSLVDPEVTGWAIRRDGGDFDQLTGASITPRAVVSAVRETLLYFQDNRDIVFSGGPGFLNDTQTIRERFHHGLWHDNPGLVQLLGICPLLAVTTSFVNGFGLGIATLFVLSFSNVLVSATRRLIRPEIRIPMYVLIISSLVTCIELIMLAWFPEMGRSLGIFVPLIVTNCAIVARAEIYASRNPVRESLLDGLAMGSGFAILLMAIGVARELVGQGTILGRLDMLFGGEPMSGVVLVDGGFLLAILPPGAFFALGLFIAGKNAFDRRRQQTSRALSSNTLR